MLWAMFSAPTQSSAAPNIAPTTETAVASAPKWTCTPATAADFPFFVELELEFEPPTGPVEKKLPATGAPSPRDFAKERTSKFVMGDDAFTSRDTSASNVAGLVNRRSVYLCVLQPGQPLYSAGAGGARSAQDTDPRRPTCAGQSQRAARG